MLYHHFADGFFLLFWNFVSVCKCVWVSVFVYVLHLILLQECKRENEEGILSIFIDSNGATEHVF